MEQVEICAMVGAHKECKRLKQRELQLMARVDRLEKSLSGLQSRLRERFEFVLGQISSDLQAEYEHSLEVLNESDWQSLSEHDADVIVNAANNLYPNYLVDVDSSENHFCLTEYANELRKLTNK